MKTIKYTILVIIVILLHSCSVDYYNDENRPEKAPTSAIMNRAQKRSMDVFRDVWFSGRMSLLWVQYWGQKNYTEEDRYQYRETVNKSSWDNVYLISQNLVNLIEYNTDPKTKDEMQAYGPNENQIAAARIMLVSLYLNGLELWGDIPYWSYLSNDPNFQANKLMSNGNSMPAYATQEAIYADMLNTLDEAQQSINVDKTMILGDNFYNGDPIKWKKLANSLRLRIANRIKGVYPEALDHINDAKDKAFSSNADNAGVQYEANALSAAPMYRAFVVDGRNDFSPTISFVELLQGKRGPFGMLDPRLDIFVDDNVDGFKVGVPLVSNNAEVNAFKKSSKPGMMILAPDYKEILMEYSEVCFIMSEIHGWDQDWYENGVRASMEKWGVSPDEIGAYITALPPANEENVMTQKYIALYMQPMEAWSEYRRLGYPKTFIKPNVPYEYSYETPDGIETQQFQFVPIGGLKDLPNRNRYPLNEESVNRSNVNEAKSRVGAGYGQGSKLWWQN